MKLPPRSTNRSSCACDTSSVLSLPNVIVPRHCADTTVPVPPRVRYSMTRTYPAAARSSGQHVRAGRELGQLLVGQEPVAERRGGRLLLRVLVDRVRRRRLLLGLEVGNATALDNAQVAVAQVPRGHDDVDLRCGIGPVLVG